MIAESPFETYKDQVGVKLSFVLTDEDKMHHNSLKLISYSAYKARAWRDKGFKLKQGRGAGNEVLLCWNALPSKWQVAIKEVFGEPNKAYNPLQKFFKLSSSAKVFFDQFQDDDGEYLTLRQKKKYTLNASVLEAIIDLYVDRKAQRKARSGSLRGIWDTIKQDTINFNQFLKEHGYGQHSLPSTVKYLKLNVSEFKKFRYHSLIDKRGKSKNAQIVTAEMIDLWKSIYAGQRRYKPTYKEVAIRYQAFLNGELEITSIDTGEQFDPSQSYFKPASESTIYSYQKFWENRVSTHAKRSGDRQKFKALYEPYAKLKMPNFAGSIISIDDRQPPFKNEEGKRIWFYLGVDLGSSAFTTWVYGSSKDGIIVDFYRQMVRNYSQWGFNIPYELECEMSLNSSFRDTLLQPGAMFQEVHIEPNNARAKRIEAYFKQVRYGREKKLDGWLPRPHARDEANQGDVTKIPRLETRQIIENSLRVLEEWNNELHPNQELHAGMTRWDVFIEKQHPELTPTNWKGILPHIGYRQTTSMKAGRILLQGKARVVGNNGKVALGDNLISIMKRIEGKDVVVYWLDDNQGQVMKALVYDTEDKLICELLGDLGYSRAKLERTPQDDENQKLFSAYQGTVQRFITEGKAAIEPVVLVEKPKEFKGKHKFIMPGISRFEPSDEQPETLSTPDTLPAATKSFSTNTKDRF